MVAQRMRADIERLDLARHDLKPIKARLMLMQHEEAG